jgi:glycerophosphoryl diester phosphodiesterase
MIGFALIAGLPSAQAQQWKTLDGKRPIVIGHRGASGYLPEHTIVAYRRAIEMGADFVEPDLVMTKDRVLIARHEPLLDGTTDVASRPEFASRKSTKTLDGIPTEGFYASDFTLAEIRQLRAIQPNAARPKNFDGFYLIPTLDEIIQMVQFESQSRGRTIGIYPETKHPTFHFALGLPMEEELLRILAKYGMTEQYSPVIIQSFESANLMYLRTRTRARLVQLIDANDVNLDGSLDFTAPYDKPYNATVSGDPRGFADLVKPAGLADIKKYADGIGPWKRYIVSVRSTDANGDGRADDVNRDGAVNDADRAAMPPTRLVEEAHRAGLFVHAYTFRNEKPTLAADYNGNPENEYVHFFLLGVDGVFSDFPDTAIAARRTASDMLPR